MSIILFFIVYTFNAKAESNTSVILDFADMDLSITVWSPNKKLLERYICPPAPLDIRGDFILEISESIENL